MPNVTPDQAEALLKKLDEGAQLSAQDISQLSATVRSLAAMVAVQDAQIGELALTIEILESESDAIKASRAAALSSLRIIAPPAASINVDEALEQAAMLRKKVAESASMTQMAIAATRFAVGIATKFI